MKPTNLKDYFHFTRPERNGLMTLVLLIILSLGLPELYPLFIPAPTVDFKLLEEKIADLENEHGEVDTLANTLFHFNINTVTVEELKRLGLAQEVAEIYVNFRRKIGGFAHKEELKKVYGLDEETYQRLLPYMELKTGRISSMETTELPDAHTEKTTPVKQLFAFDPNTISADSLNLLMIPENILRTIQNYRANGGNFHIKKDLLKIYGMTEEIYENIAPFLLLPEELKAPPQPVSFEDNTYQRRLPVTIDVNKASPEEWQQLRGIGPGYARRIVSFRDQLGGFSSVDQVAETYYFPDSTFQKIKPFLAWSPIPNKININTCTEEDLKQHPYISYRQAGAIIAFRKHHGPFPSLKALEKIHGLPKETLEKILPYLEIQSSAN